MSDKTADVLLISQDAGLARVLERHCPQHASLVTMSPAEAATRPLPPCRHRWLDLDGLSAPPVEAASRNGVYFYSKMPEPTIGLPAGLLIRKPCESGTAAMLWSTVRPAAPTRAGASGGADAGTIPSWLADFHVLELRDLSQRIVGALPQLLGFREASLFLLDEAQAILSLATSSCTRPIDLAVSLSSRQHLMAAVARDGKWLESDEAPAARKRLGVEQPSDERMYADSSFLIAPLMCAGRLIGVLNLSARTGAPRPPRAILEAVFAFVARGLRYACEHEVARLEARVDELTGLFNYRWLIETLDREVLRAERFGAPLSLFMLDLDGLKGVNDRHGHLAGDALLRHVAGRIRRGLRQIDSAARSGGDEFVVILPATNAVGAQLVAERVLRSICDEPVSFRRVTLRATASIGVAEWKPGWNAERLLEAADQAMYAAKHGGRARLASAEGPASRGPA